MTDLPNPNLKPKPFALPEYARAQFKFVHEGVRRLMEAKDEVWASLQRRPPTEAVPVTQNTMPGGGVIQNQPVTSKTKFIFKFEDIRLCDTAALAAQMDSAADQQLSVVMPHFFEVLRRTSEAAGTAIDAGGKPFSFETWLEMLERIDFDFDDQGNPDLPTLIMHPDQAKQLQALPPPTVEELRALADLIDRKRGEHHARKRHRKLH